MNKDNLVDYKDKQEQLPHVFKVICFWKTGKKKSVLI